MRRLFKKSRFFSFGCLRLRLRVFEFLMSFLFCFSFVQFCGCGRFAQIATIHQKLVHFQLNFKFFKKLQDFTVNLISQKVISSGSSGSNGRGVNFLRQSHLTEQFRNATVTVGGPFVASHYCFNRYSLVLPIAGSFLLHFLVPFV